MFLVRRLMLALSILLLSSPVQSNEGPVLGDDGLYHHSWFLESFLELKDDIDRTAESGKRLAIFWELKGCPYCRETHITNLTRTDISEFIRAHFEVLQLNVLGSRIVTDVDGEEMTEKKLAKKYGIVFTPTIQFLKSDSSAIAELKPREREVARLQGYLKPDDFLAMFRFVQGKSFETTSFRKYLRKEKQP